MSSFPVVAGIKKDPGPIPDLHPPRNEIAVDLPEKAILIGILAVAFAVLILGRVFRRTPMISSLPPEHPASIARHALAGLTPNSTPQAVATTCAQALRDYTRTAFALGDEALTTSEFCARFATHPLADSNSTQALQTFLTDCERAQFAPASAQLDPQTVERAHAMIELLEHQRTPSVAQPVSPVAT
jgi:hypothetical protein